MTSQDFFVLFSDCLLDISHDSRWFLFPVKISSLSMQGGARRCEHWAARSLGKMWASLNMWNQWDWRMRFCSERRPLRVVFTRVQEIGENLWMPCDQICDVGSYSTKLPLTISCTVCVRVEVYYTGIIQHYSSDLASFSNIAFVLPEVPQHAWWNVSCAAWCAGGGCAVFFVVREVEESGNADDFLELSVLIPSM